MEYYDDELTLYGLVRDIFCALSVTCVLWAAHRVGKGLVLRARIDAYDELEDAYTPEERQELIHRIKRESLRY